MLDTILDATIQRQAENAARTYATQTKGADQALLAYDAFRGRLNNVRGVPSDSLLERAGLNWTAHVTAVGAINEATGGYRIARTHQALVKGGTGDILSITSNKFKPHQNSEIVRDMIETVNAGDAEMMYLGALDNNRRVVGVARLQGEFSLPDKRHRDRARNDHAGSTDDTTYLYVVISGGHEPGTPFTIRAMGFRQWCGNGAFFSVNARSTYRRTHRGSLDARTIEDIRETFSSMRSEFETYGQTAERLQAVEADRDQRRLVVAELLQSGAARELATRLGVEPQTVYASVRGGHSVLDTMLAEDAYKTDRLGVNILDAIVAQQGGNGTDDLWAVKQGIDWYVDHKRGKSADTGVDAALFGAGATLKARGLEVVKQFAGVV